MILFNLYIYRYVCSLKSVAVFLCSYLYYSSLSALSDAAENKRSKVEKERRAREAVGELAGWQEHQGAPLPPPLLKTQNSNKI